jgi:hypothetical protein
VLVEHRDVMMGLRPVIADEDHPSSSPRTAKCELRIESKQSLGDLMAQCSKTARHLISDSLSSLAGRRTLLGKSSSPQWPPVLTGRRLDPTSLAPTPD